MGRKSKQLDMFKPNQGEHIPIDIPNGWTRESYESARAMWLAGMTESQIGAAHGRSRHVINGIAHRFGWPPRESPIIRSEKTDAPAAPKPLSFSIRPPLPAGHPLTWDLISNGMPFPGDAYAKAY
jgi:hypothetical protein